MLEGIVKKEFEKEGVNDLMEEDDVLVDPGLEPRVRNNEAPAPSTSLQGPEQMISSMKMKQVPGASEQAKFPLLDSSNRIRNDWDGAEIAEPLHGIPVAGGSRILTILAELPSSACVEDENARGEPMPPAAADAALAGHEGLEVDYAVAFRWRRA